MRHDDYWWLVKPITEDGLNEYWDWFKALDSETQLKIVTNNDSEELPKDLLNTILHFFPKPEKLGSGIVQRSGLKFGITATPIDATRRGIYGVGTSEILQLISSH